MISKVALTYGHKGVVIESLMLRKIWKIFNAFRTLIKSRCIKLDSLSLSQASSIISCKANVKSRWCKESSKIVPGILYLKFKLILFISNIYTANGLKVRSQFIIWISDENWRGIKSAPISHCESFFPRARRMNESIFNISVYIDKVRWFIYGEVAEHLPRPVSNPTNRPQIENLSTL